MANQFFNFYYDPIRQGYDLNTWNTVSGVPAVVAGKLQLNTAAILHFADLLRGDAIFSVNIAAPAAGDDTKFGFIEYNKDAHLYFKILDDVLTAETSDGSNTGSTVIDWVADWTNTNTEFRIKWEAGQATFFIGGQFKAVFSIGAPTDALATIIPYDPMCLYASALGTNPLNINYIETMAIQSSTLETGTV